MAVLPLQVAAGLNQKIDTEQLNWYKMLLFRSVSTVPLLCAGVGNHTCIQRGARSVWAGKQHS